MTNEEAIAIADEFLWDDESRSVPIEQLHTDPVTLAALKRCVYLAGKLRIGMNRIAEHWESGVDEETESRPWYRQMRELLDHYEGEYK